MSSEPAIQPSPEDVVRAYIAALNAHDIDQAQALVAPDCMRHIGWEDTATPEAPCRRRGAELAGVPRLRYDLQAVTLWCAPKGATIMSRSTAPPKARNSHSTRLQRTQPR